MKFRETKRNFYETSQKEKIATQTEKIFTLTTRKKIVTHIKFFHISLLKINTTML